MSGWINKKTGFTALVFITVAFLHDWWRHTAGTFGL